MSEIKAMEIELARRFAAARTVAPSVAIAENLIGAAKLAVELADLLTKQQEAWSAKDREALQERVRDGALAAAKHLEAALTTAEKRGHALAEDWMIATECDRPDDAQLRIEELTQKIEAQQRRIELIRAQRDTALAAARRCRGRLAFVSPDRPDFFAGNCSICGGPVYHRDGYPGEYDHECSGVEVDAEPAEPTEDEREAIADWLESYIGGEPGRHVAALIRGGIHREACDHPEVVPTGDGYGVCTSCGDNTFPIDSEACDG